jgi:hypothetical protein
MNIIKRKLPSQASYTNERFVYEVPSSINSKICYRVDVLANSGAGHCNCPDFGTRRQPAIDAGELIISAQTTCKHLQKARDEFLRVVMPRLAQTEDYE